MPSPPLIDIDKLIAPIPGVSPAGGPVPFADGKKLEDARKEDRRANYEESDPRRPEADQNADWVAVTELASDTLAATSKDLLVAARLVEALTREHGFGGLRDGLRLMRRLITECWGRLHPAIESEDDMEVRAAPFYWLDEADRGARFPISVRMIPMIGGEAKRFSWNDWKQSQSGKAGTTAADIGNAMKETPLEHSQTTFEDLDEAWLELDALTTELKGRLGENAPALTGVRQAVGECRALAQQVLREVLKLKGPEPPQIGGGEGPNPGDETSPATRGGSFVGQQVASRAQVYQQLAQAAAMLQQLEPHSPIPYLIQRAVELGALPFPDLMRALIRDAEVLAGMNRELGIKEPGQ
jgi:type VI secretion system protein ImpA